MLQGVDGHCSTRKYFWHSSVVHERVNRDLAIWINSSIVRATTCMFTELPITRRLPSGVNSRSFVLKLSSERSSLPVVASHSRVVPSLAAVAIHLPSGEKRAFTTVLVCPESVSISLPIAV